MSTPEARTRVTPFDCNPLRMSALLDAAGHPYHWQPAPSGAREVAILDTTNLQTLAPLPAIAANPDHIIADLMHLKDTLS